MWGLWSGFCSCTLARQWSHLFFVGVIASRFFSPHLAWESVWLQHRIQAMSGATPSAGMLGETLSLDKGLGSGDVTVKKRDIDPALEELAF